MTENDKIIKRHLVLKSISNLNFIFFAADILILIFVEIVLNLGKPNDLPLPIFQSVLFLYSFMVVSYICNSMLFNRLRDNEFYNDIIKNIISSYKEIAIRFIISILNFILMKLFINSVFTCIFLFCFLSGLLRVIKLVNILFKFMTLRLECEG